VLLVFLTTGIIVYVATNKARITIVVDDPKAVVHVDGESLRIESLAQPITLRAGEHALAIKWGSGESQTRSFVLKRGDDEVLRVDYQEASSSERSKASALPRPDEGHPGPNSAKVATGARSKAPTIAFNDRNARSIGPGKWRIERGELAQDAPGNGLPGVMLFFGDSRWTDYIVTAEMKKVSGPEGFGLAFRCTDRANCFVLNLGCYGNKNHEVFNYDQVTHWSRNVPVIPGKVETSRWYEVRVEARGNRFQCFLDNHMLFDFTDDRNPNGSVGLRTWGDCVRFRNLKVTDLGGTTLWQGMPELGSQR
jgi:hypothetical protein